MNDRLLVLLSFPGSGEGCSRLWGGRDDGGIAFADVERGARLGKDCLLGMGGLWGDTALCLSSRDDNLSGCRTGGRCTGGMFECMDEDRGG